jgi:nitrogen fixation protein NifU and related proteins
MSHVPRHPYDATLVDHGRSPRNFGPLERATHRCERSHPLCGDRLQVQLMVKDEHIEKIRFEGRGCILSMASASIMSEAVQGLTRAEASALASRLREALTPGHREPLPDPARALEAARHAPGRRGCIALAWQALEAALGPSEETGSP